MTRARSVLPILMAGILCAAIGWSGIAQPTRVIIVPPSESLQKAIASAPEGAVIQLQAREYTENVVIEKSLTLRGFSDEPEAAVLAAKSGGPVVTLRGMGEIRVVLEGFTIEGAKGYLPDGVYILGSGTATLRNLVVRECRGSGIRVHGDGHVSVDRCALIDNHAYGLTVANPTAGVSGSENRFEGNGAPLGLYAPPELRTPLAEQADHETVRVPEDYETIQAAVDAVLPGGTVEVGPGEFVEGITLWKDVVVRGQGRTETTLSALEDRGFGLSILHSAGAVELEDLAISASGENPIDLASRLHTSDVAFIGRGGVHLGWFLAVARGGQLIANDCRFAEIGGTAIYSDEETTVRLEGCAFEDGYAGLRVNGSTEIVDCRFERIRDVQVYIERGEFSIERTAFRDGLNGLGIGDAQGAVRECAFGEISDTCLIIASTPELSLAECSFGEAKYGVRVFGESTVTFEDCNLAGTTSAAIQIYGLASATLKACEILDNQGLGVEILEHGNGTIVDSSIRANGFNAWDELLNRPVNGSGVHVTRNASLWMENVVVTSNAGPGVSCSTEEISSPFDRAEPTEDSARVVLIGCRFEGNDGPGVFAYDSQEISARDCGFVRQTFGLFLGGLSSANIEASSFSANAVGIYGQDCSQLHMRLSLLETNSHAGLMLGGQAGAIVEASEFADNGIGILLTEATVLALSSSSVVRSLTYGLSLGCTECWPIGLEYDPSWDFTGLVAGFGNRIPDVGEPDANRSGAFCPEDVGRELLTPGEDQV